MKSLLAAIAFACLALATSGGASGATAYGVSDDHGKYADDGGAWFFSEMVDAGLTVNKMTVNWDPENPLVIRDKAFLDRSIPQAEERGIHISFGIHIGKARAITGNPAAIGKFQEFLRLLVRTYPQVDEYIVGNEPNLTRFWQPQFNPNGTGASGVAFASFLARSYDTLKAANPNITVVGVGLSPRGNDRPDAPSNISTSPVRFINDLGRGYRAMARNKPIMDVFGFHPYPWRDRDSLEKGYTWPNAGVANLDRIKQAFWDAFHGTAQPIFPEGNVSRLDARKPYLTFKLDEVGWQVAIPRVARNAYHGRESVRPTDEWTQARIYGQLVRRVACDPAVRQMLFFGLVDEPNLDRWQAALIRADGTRRASFNAVRDAVADTAEGCTGRPDVWRHTEEVVGARITELNGRVVVTADEDATVLAKTFPRGTSRAEIARLLVGRPAKLKAYRSARVPLGGVVAVRVRAAMNPRRTSLFVFPG